MGPLRAGSPFFPQSMRGFHLGVRSSKILIFCLYFPASPLNWNTIFDREKTSTDVSIGYILIMFVVDTLGYLFLTYYINAVNPGRFGSKKPWYFLFHVSKLKLFVIKIFKSIRLFLTNILSKSQIAVQATNT